MRIEVLGSGCARCKQTHKLIAKRVVALGAEVTVIEVRDLVTMMAYQGDDLRGERVHDLRLLAQR